MSNEEILLKYGGGSLKGSYSIAQVQHILSCVTLSKKEPVKEEEFTIPKFKGGAPTTIKKGDMFLAGSLSCKVRPYVVALIKEDMAYCIALTTTKDEHALIPYKSRFQRDGFYCNSFTVSKLQNIKKNFVGIMDDNRNLNKAIKLITEKIIKDLQ